MGLKGTAPPKPEPLDHYRGYPLTLLLGTDSYINVLAGGRFGDTVSARVGRNMAFRGWWKWPRWWANHCCWAAGLPQPYPPVSPWVQWVSVATIGAVLLALLCYWVLR